MYISRVRLENIRGFTGPRTVDLTLTRPDGSHAGWTVLAGPNGAGKTTLLRALALAISGPSVALGLTPGLQNWISLGRKSATTEAILQWDAEADKWLSSIDDRPQPVRSSYQWVDVGVELPTRSGMRSVALTSVSDIPDAGPWQPISVGWLCVGYGSFRRLFGGTSEAALLAQTPGPIGRLTSLFREDGSLAEGVQWLIGQHLRAFEKRPGAAELKSAALEILSNGLFPGKYQITDIDSEGLWVMRDGERFPLREMSDGYRSLGAMCVDLLKQVHDCYGSLAVEDRDGTPAVTQPGIVLIDEADAHLHMYWQRHIGPWLKAHFPNIQFIVTTHSPYICQAADEGGLIRIPGPREDFAPHAVEERLYRQIVYGSGDDAAISELFGLDSPYSAEADRLREHLAALWVKMTQGQANEEEIAEYRTLRQHLASSPSTRAEEMLERLIATYEQDK